MVQWRLLAALRSRVPSWWIMPSSSSSVPPGAYCANETTVAPPQSNVVLASHTSYGAYIGQYIRDLEAHCKLSNDALLNARLGLETALSEQAKICDDHRREYARTFVPLVFVIVLFMREQTNRSCAEQTHSVLKERADKFCSLKRIVI